MSGNNINAAERKVSGSGQRMADMLQQMRRAWPRAGLGLGLLANAGWIALICYGLIKLL
jgi:hypothetical protein